MKIACQSLFLVIIVWMSVIVGAQDKSVYQGHDIRFIHWLPDSSGITFTAHDSLIEPQQDFLYDVGTQKLSSYDSSISMSTLQILTENSPLPLYGEGPSSIYPSPDGSFAVYMVEFSQYYPVFALMDIKTGRTDLLRGTVMSFLYAPLPNLVKWARNSTAFTLELDGVELGNNEGYIDEGYYIKILDHNVNTLQTIQLYSYIYDINYDDQYSGLYEQIGYEIQNAMDVDATGQFLLVKAFQPSQESWHLLMIDMKTLAVEIVANIDAKVAAGIFQQPSNSTVTYATSEGIFEYDLLTHTSHHLINPDYNFYINISPDGHYGAFVKENKLYILTLKP